MLLLLLVLLASSLPGATTKKITEPRMALARFMTRFLGHRILLEDVHPTRTIRSLCQLPKCVQTDGVTLEPGFAEKPPLRRLLC